MVANIDRIFTRVPALPDDLILFRGFSLKFRDNKPYQINEEFIDKGYVSTSVSFEVAEYFASGAVSGDSADSRKVVFAIYNNLPGEKGILIDQEEDEVILKHGLKFRVMAKKERVGKYELYLVQACSGPCEISLRKDAGVFWNDFNPQ
jgi:hypothetical protein